MDQQKDLNGQETHRICTLWAPPSYVKTASVADRCGDADMPLAAYADPGRREYPQHTPAAVWLSTAFLLDKELKQASNAGPRILRNLLDAGEYFGISESLQQLQKAAKEAHETSVEQLPDSLFALVIQNPDQTTSRHYPLRNRNEVEKAAAYFEQHRRDFISTHRRTIATKILDRAESTNANVGKQLTMLQKSAGMGLGDPNDVVSAISLRTLQLKTTPLGDSVVPELIKLAETVKQNFASVCHYDTMCDLIDTLDTIDRAYKLANMQLPEDSICSITQKEASTLDSELVSTVSGNVYHIEDLRKLELEKLANFMGQEFADSLTVGGAFLDFEKLAEIVPTLPLDDAVLFDLAAQDCGIPPLTKQAGEPRTTLRDAVKQNLQAVPVADRARGPLWDAIYAQS